MNCDLHKGNVKQHAHIYREMKWKKVSNTFYPSSNPMNQNYHKVSPGGFIAPNLQSNPGGFRPFNPNTRPGGFHVPQAFHDNNSYPDKHRNSLNQYPPVTVPPFPPDNNRRDSFVISPTETTYPSYPPSINPLSGKNGYPSPKLYNPTTNPEDLQSRFYGTCKACGKPNTDFAECSSCKNWILQMETTIQARKSLIGQQLCTKCQLPKHVHGQIAACTKCGFPKSCINELNEIGVKNENNNNLDNNKNNDKKIDLICGNCNNPLANYLKCPTFIEISQRMRKERECLPFEDPNFAKLSKIIKLYSDLEKRKDTNSTPSHKN